VDYQIEWTEPAQWDLQAIWTHIAADNPSAADRLRDAIFGQVKLLETLPRLGPTYSHRARGEIRHLVVGNYRIFYEIFEGRHRIDILTVRHAARREPFFNG
jgi:toxin ParE1/3/4